MAGLRVMLAALAMSSVTTLGSGATTTKKITAYCDGGMGGEALSGVWRAWSDFGGSWVVLKFCGASPCWLAGYTHAPPQSFPPQIVSTTPNTAPTSFQLYICLHNLSV